MRNLTTLILLVCALVVGTQGATITLGPGADYETFAALVVGAGSLDGDTIKVINDYDDPQTSRVDYFNTYTVVWDFDSHTINFTSIASTDYVLKLNAASSWTFLNGAINTSGGGVNVVAGAAVVMNDFDIHMTGSGSVWAAQLSNAGASLAATNCAFSRDSSLVTMNTSLLSRSTAAASFDIDSCEFSDCYKGVYGTGLASNVSITNSTFTDCAGAAIDLGGGGDATITGNTITCRIGYAGLAYAARVGILFSTPSGTTCNATISNNTIAPNGTHGLYFGRPGAYDQGVGGIISGNVFGGDSTTYGCTIQANGVTITDNRFIGSRLPNAHLLMLGTDAGTDLGSKSRAYSINVYLNRFEQEVAPRVDGSSSYHCIVVKCDSASVYNNWFDIADLLVEEQVNTSCVFPKGAANFRFYNNTLASRESDARAIRVGEQGGTNTTNLLVANNKIVAGDFLYDIFLDDNHQMSGASVTNNRMGLSGYQTDTPFTLSTDSTWFDTNFTDDDDLAWAVLWGGIGPLPGITGTEQGLYPIGVQTATAASSVKDPFISVYQPGFATPFGSYQTLDRIGKSGVMLYHQVRTNADLASAIYWTGSYPAGSTKTYADEYKGVLVVVGATN